MSETEVRLEEFDSKISAKKCELSDNMSEKARYEHELSEQKEALRAILDEIENVKVNMLDFYTYTQKKKTM